MEDLPTSLLLQQGRARPRSGEELETFGKYAASLYLGGKCAALSEAVVEAVKTAGLSPEQVKRVVEFTNTSAYLEKFAAEGPHHKVVNFAGGPADFPTVIRDLNDGGGGSVYDPAHDDYALPPPDTAKMAAANLDHLGYASALLTEAFRGTEVPLPYTSPLRDAEDAQSKLASLHDEALSEIGSLELRFLEATDALFKHVKQASLEGTPLGHILAAWQVVEKNPEFVKAAFTDLSPRLVQNGVFPNLTAVAESLTKTAGAGRPNPEHPLLTTYGVYCSTLAKLAATRQVADEVAEQLGAIGAFIQKTAGLASGAREVVTEHVPKAWGVARDLAARASEPVGEFVGDLSGSSTLGQLAGGAVKYAPHIGVGLAAEELYQRAKANPAIHAGANFVLARVPYTQQNLIRQYQLQGGGF